jgi:hypothetical protein
MIMIFVCSLEKWHKKRKLICSVTRKELRVSVDVFFLDQGARGRFYFNFLLLLLFLFRFGRSVVLLIIDFCTQSIIRGGGSSVKSKIKLLIPLSRGYRLMSCIGFYFPLVVVVFFFFDFTFSRIWWFFFFPIEYVRKIGGERRTYKISIALHYISGDGVFYGRRTRSKLIMFLPLIFMLYFSFWGFSDSRSLLCVFIYSYNLTEGQWLSQIV